mgnify:CR=1 FL=1
MLQITTTLNNPTIVHLNSSALTSGLSTASFTLTAIVGGVAATASNISLATTEVSATHYTASMSFSKLGNHYVKLVRSTFSLEIFVEVVEESLPFLTGRLAAAEAEYTLTVNDGTNNIEGALVRVFNNTETQLLGRYLSDTNGQVILSLPAASYKARISKTGFTFTNPQSFTVVAGSGLDPEILEVFPTTLSAGGSFVIRARNLTSDVKISLNSATAVAPTSMSVSSGLIIHSIASNASGSVSVQLSKVVGSSTLTSAVKTITVG